MSSRAGHDDPRDSSLETKEVLPNTWYRETLADGLSTTGMLLAGLIVVSRNRYLAWPCILFGLACIINAHPMRSKDGSGNAWSTLLLCITALFATYFPHFVITKPIPPPAA